MGKVLRLLVCAVILLSVLHTAFGQDSEREPRFQFVYRSGRRADLCDRPAGRLGCQNKGNVSQLPHVLPLFHPVRLNLEQRLRLGSTNSHFAFQELFLVGGMDQGIFLPSFDFLIGFRSHWGLQFGLGPT